MNATRFLLLVVSNILYWKLNILVGPQTESLPYNPGAFGYGPVQLLHQGFIVTGSNTLKINPPCPQTLRIYGTPFIAIERQAAWEHAVGNTPFLTNKFVFTSL